MEMATITIFYFPWTFTYPAVNLCPLHLTILSCQLLSTFHHHYRFLALLERKYFPRTFSLKFVLKFRISLLCAVLSILTSLFCIFLFIISISFLLLLVCFLILFFTYFLSHLSFFYVFFFIFLIVYRKRIIITI